MPENPLRTIMRPSSIAIVGASNNLTKMGTIQYLNLVGGGYSGEIFPIHPKEKSVLGTTAYAAIDELPYAPDLAVLVVPTHLVPGLLEEFGRIGTKHAVIISAGFRETGGHGHDLERTITEIAANYAMRFVGPNCVGIINTQLSLNLTVHPVMDLEGKLGIASQSGTYVTQTLPYLHKHGIALSKAISIGNGTNIDIVDCLEYLGDDDATTAIALYIEGITRADDFLDMARRISFRKPIIAQYVGGTEAGARAGSSHTGAMAGPDFVYDGLFEQAGIIRVDSIEEVYKTGWVLASQPPLEGPRIAVLTNSGGPGTGIATTCEKHGLRIPEFSVGVQEEIGQFIAGHASARNPIDLTFNLDMSLLAHKIPRVVFNTDEIDGIIIHGIIDTGFFDNIYPLISRVLNVPEDQIAKMPVTELDQLIEMPFAHHKPLIISSFFDDEDNCVNVFRKRGVPVFDAPEKAARAMAALFEHYNIRRRHMSEPRVRVNAPAEAVQLVGQVNGNAIDEYHAKRILSAYGIPTTKEIRATTWEETLTGAHAIGYPVVLKVCSPDILHKTEADMVFLNVEDDVSLQTAFSSIRGKDGASPVLVSEMIEGDREFMAGMSYFPGFPPCIMFGLGGIYTEVLKDTTIRLAPISRGDAVSMLESLSASALLGSYRGLKPVDREMLASLLVALGQLALDFPVIREIDLNPIIIRDGKPVVVDALFIAELQNNEQG